MKRLENCMLCPRNCGVDRTKKIGFCRAGNEIKIARAKPHMWEEPSISGTNGSGTVFFSHCNLKCVFCQNYDISTKNHGYKVTTKELADIFLDFQNKAVHNINLVTPTHYIPQIIEAIQCAKDMGLNLPIVYNCGGYESAEAIDMLKGYIDIYMPDMKYYRDKSAIRYSMAPNYFEISKKAIEKMFLQVGKNQFDKFGKMTKGVIVRHMMLPGLMYESKKIVDYLYNTYGDDIYISIMSQYTPTNNLADYPEIDRKIDKSHYEMLVEYCANKGMRNVYIQDGTAASESFIPDFYPYDE